MINVVRDEPAAVYRAYDENGQPLYIGSSYRPQERIRQHARAPWFTEVARWTVDWLPGRLCAFQLERELIRLENPRYNVAGRPGSDDE